MESLKFRKTYPCFFAYKYSSEGWSRPYLLNDKIPGISGFIWEPSMSALFLTNHFYKPREGEKMPISHADVDNFSCGCACNYAFLDNYLSLTNTNNVYIFTGKYLLMGRPQLLGHLVRSHDALCCLFYELLAISRQEESPMRRATSRG